MATYNRFSPYHKTEQTWHLGHYKPISIKPASDDTIYTIPNKYHQQPWRVAHDFYGNERLHWVFALANMDTIRDPLFDFNAGTVIRVPTNERIQGIIGGN